MLYLEVEPALRKKTEEEILAVWPKMPADNPLNRIGDLRKFLRKRKFVRKGCVSVGALLIGACIALCAMFWAYYDNQVLEGWPQLIGAGLCVIILMSMMAMFVLMCWDNALADRQEDYDDQLNKAARLFAMNYVDILGRSAHSLGEIGERKLKELAALIRWHENEGQTMDPKCEALRQRFKDLHHLLAWDYQIIKDRGHGCYFPK